MLQWFQRLLPRQDAFFPAFERHAAVMVKAAVALREMLAGGDQLKPCFQEILDLEHEADGIAREVRYTIGRYPDWPLATARAEAKKLKLEVRANGSDPLARLEAERSAP